ncbi:MAG: DUF2804 domain-containing protein [Bacteriovoracales bacterium]
MKIKNLIFLTCFFLNISFAREFKQPEPVLRTTGELNISGWAKNPIFIYNPQFIPDNLKSQKKEWEHYTVVGKDFALSLTLLNIGFTVAALVDFCNYEKNIYYSNFFNSLENFQNYPFNPTPYGKTYWEKDGEFISFVFKDGIRYLDFYFKNKIVIAPIKGSLQLIQPEESVAVVRPFSQPGLFFYENKVFGMPSEGKITVNGESMEFNKTETSSILDWGRGVWPKTGSWYWGFAHGKSGGLNIALNMSYGYGNDSNGSVNALLVNGKIQKLDKINWIFDPHDLMKPWEVESNDGRVRLIFSPISFVPVDLDVLVYFAKLKKLYGTFSGEIMLDDGRVLRINNFYGFTEKLLYKW